MGARRRLIEGWQEQATEYLQIRLTPAVKARISELAERSGAKSISEFARRAWAIYDFLIEHELAGGTVVLHQEGQRDRRLVFTPDDGPVVEDDE